MLPHARSTATLAALLVLAGATASCRSAGAPGAAAVPANAPLQTPPPLAALGRHRVIPMPASVVAGRGTPFALTASTAIVVPPGDSAAARVGEMVATLLRPATGFPLPVSAGDGAPAAGSIALQLGGPATLGDEGYELTIDAERVRLVAARPAGLFRGMQTLRQLLPAGIEAEQSTMKAASAWTIPPGRITDRPRFAWRGGMLDVARHFFTVDEVRQYIDLLALYKLNTLHLHLSDDQGWRIQIDSWPRLATVGGATEVGGGPGGYYTKADYAAIVRYAGERFITVVPEIDMPAHTHAAIAAYPELGCSRPMPDTMFTSPVPGLYTGIRVGWSALCHDREVTYKFVDDVVRELAAMTPGPFFHIGGDEVEALSHPQYAEFIERVQAIVARHGKTVVGWDEIGRARLRPGSIAQLWRADTAMAAARQGAKLILSPATKAYMDMKYTPATEIGLRWAAFIPLRTAYDWDPVTHFAGVTESNVVGVEAPLWTETVQNITAAQSLLLPRLPAIAEVGWTAAAGKDWDSFRTRIAAHAPRWRFLGLAFDPSPQVAW